MLIRMASRLNNQKRHPYQSQWFISKSKWFIYFIGYAYVCVFDSHSVNLSSTRHAASNVHRQKRQNTVQSGDKNAKHVKQKRIKNYVTQSRRHHSWTVYAHWTFKWHLVENEKSLCFHIAFYRYCCFFFSTTITNNASAATTIDAVNFSQVLFRNYIHSADAMYVNHV